MTAAKKLVELVDEAAANEIELRRLESQDCQLSPKAYLAACAAVPGASITEANAVATAMEGHEAQMLAPSFRRMQKGITDFKRTGPHLKLAGYMDSEGDAALARIGATRQSLFLAAARQVAERRPELFGTATKVGETYDGIRECIDKRAELFAAISTGWTAADVLVERDRVSFRCTGGIVAVSENLAENLVNFAVTEIDQSEAA